MQGLTESTSGIVEAVSKLDCIKDFHLLNPVYNIDGKDIEEYIKTIIKKEYVI